MKCKHVLCISCAVTLQRKRERFCPLCRGDVVMEADAGRSYRFHRQVFYTCTDIADV
jgi:hypothetical protein